MSDVIIDAEKVVLLDPSEGDIILVTLPESVSDDDVGAIGPLVSEQFEAILEDKKVKVIVIPHNMKVEILTASMLDDK